MSDDLDESKENSKLVELDETLDSDTFGSSSFASLKVGFTPGMDGRTRRVSQL